MEYKLRYWIPLAIALSALTFSFYVMCQQLLRLSANDPQIAVSEDIANVLASGAAIEKLLPPDIDLATSSSLFVSVYDQSGKIVSSTAKLDGMTPEVPAGVLDFAKSHGQNRLTWQPKKNIREAVVVTFYQGVDRSGYVLAGRSLRESEQRSEILLHLAGLTWIGSMLSTFVVTLILINKPYKK